MNIKNKQKGKCNRKAIPICNIDFHGWIDGWILLHLWFSPYARPRAHTHTTRNKTFWNHIIISLYQEISYYMMKATHSKSSSMVTYEDISSAKKYKGQDHNYLILSDATQNNKEYKNKCLPTGNQHTPSWSMIHGPHNYHIFWLRGSTRQ
jgi:hypothetical protein